MEPKIGALNDDFPVQKRGDFFSVPFAVHFPFVSQGVGPKQKVSEKTDPGQVLLDLARFFMGFYLQFLAHLIGDRLIPERSLL